MNKLQLELNEIIKIIDDEVRIDDDVSGGYLQEPFDKIVSKLYQLQDKLSERQSNTEIKQEADSKALNIGIVMWRFLLILLIIPCFITDIVGLIPMIILIKMDENNSPYSYLQYLFELW